MIISLTILFLIIDLLSKYIVSKTIAINESVVLINHFLNITYVKNTGAAWSILSSNTFLITIISIIIIVGIIFYIRKYSNQRKLEIIAYAMLLGGSIGNLFNRIINGYVIDFISINLFGWNYPIFNLADIFIVLGVMLYMVDTWRNQNDRIKSSR